MEIRFSKLSPTQNMTVLVEDPIPREKQAQIAVQLLSCESVGGEQVGFIESPTCPAADARLQMMGGEFCGNATMSLGTLLAWQNGLQDGKTADYQLEVSGSETLVPCHIERTGNTYRGTVRMPLPEGFGAVCLETDAGNTEFPIVYLRGISHVIVSADCGLTKEEIERRIRSWNTVVRADALGILLYDGNTQSIEPIVYVPSTDSAVWERGCGSGTAAIGCWKALSAKQSACCTIRQPGGEITVCASVEGSSVADLTITGMVKLTVRGTAYL